MLDIGSKIKNLRTQKGISQRELAREIGVANSTVCFWERNENTPRIKEMQKLCRLFGVQLTYFMEEENTNSQKRLLGVYEALNEEGQDRLLEYAIMLLSNGYIKKDK